VQRSGQGEPEEEAMTPNIAVIHLDDPCWRPFWRPTRIWVPLFLLWIPLLLLAPLFLIAVLVACFIARLNPWTAIRTAWGLLCALPGTDVRVKDPRGVHVMVRIL
jgi:hypothetical protein